MKKKATKKKTVRYASLAVHRRLTTRVNELNDRSDRLLTRIAERLHELDDRPVFNEGEFRDVLRRVHVLVSNVERIDNAAKPARGTVARRLELLEATMQVVNVRTAKNDREHRELLEELARIRVEQRALILTLQEWAPGDNDTVDSLPFRLQHMPALKSIDDEDDTADIGL